MARRKSRSKLGAVSQGLYSPCTLRLTTLVSMPAPLMFLPISSRIRMSRSNGMRPIQDFTRARVLFLRCSIIFDGHRVELGGVVIGVFENRQAAQDLARLKHLPADAADDVLQAELVCVCVIALRAGELAQADRHHLEEPALDLAGEIGVPLDAAHQHHAVRS